MKVCLIFNTAIRIGTTIAKVVGPFPSIEAAQEWFRNLKFKTSDAVIETIMSSDGDAE